MDIETIFEAVMWGGGIAIVYCALKIASCMR